MIRLREASEDEVVLAFLRAERDSSRFGEAVAMAFRERWHLLESPRLDDPIEATIRREALRCYRGYGGNAYLFAGFPTDVEWWHVSMTREDVSALFYGRDVWPFLPGGGPQARDGARQLDVIRTATPESFAAIKGVLDGLADDKSFEPIVVVAQSPEERHILLEGYARATAFSYALADDAEVPGIAGYSASLSNWHWF